MPLRAVILNCTLKSGPEPSSTGRLLELVADELRRHDVETVTLRVVDEHIRPGVSSDEGGDDGWPAIRQRIVSSQLLVVGTPIWLGHPSSMCQMVLERLDAFISETHDDGRPIGWDRVAAVAVVGNEDGAHHVAAEVFQGLDDVGFSIPPGAAVYWVGEAMGDVDFKDLDDVPEKVTSTLQALAANAVHLAQVPRRPAISAGARLTEPPVPSNLDAGDEHRRRTHCCCGPARRAAAGRRRCPDDAARAPARRAPRAPARRRPRPRAAVRPDRRGAAHARSPALDGAAPRPRRRRAPARPPGTRSCGVAPRRAGVVGDAPAGRGDRPAAHPRRDARRHHPRRRPCVPQATSAAGRATGSPSTSTCSARPSSATTRPRHGSTRCAHGCAGPTSTTSR